jgi:glycosyltransferase involved in cell wall biosynthesis
MRICLVGPVHPYRGGISHFTAMLARELSGPHEVHVTSFSRLYPGFLFPGRTQYDESASPLAVASTRVIDSINPFSWRRAADDVLAFRPDVVVFQWWHPFFAPAFRAMCRRIRRRSQARIVFLCHNVLPHESTPIDRVLVRWGLAGAHAFVVQSREDGRTLADLIPGAVVAFNPMPVFDLFGGGDEDRAAARRRLGLDGNVVLFFGLVRPYKGLGALLDAFAQCADDIDGTLLVVGEFYEPRAPYEARIHELGIGPRVRVVDRYVPNEEVGGYFRAADVVVLPYVSATQSAIAQTAFSFERPVIVTAVGGLPDVVADGETGFVVPAGDTGALAAAMVRFFREQAGERMAAAIRARSGEFAWSRCAGAILDAAARVPEGGREQQAL